MGRLPCLRGVRVGTERSFAWGESGRGTFVGAFAASFGVRTGRVVVGQRLGVFVIVRFA